MNPVREQFIGRTGELAELARTFSAARDGHPRISVVYGEAGIGKSTLVRQALGISPDFSVLQSEGIPSGHQPFAAFNQLLDPADHVDGSIAAMAAVLRLLERLDAQWEGRPVAIVLEDLHWIDAESAEALALMARRLQFGDRVAVIATSRYLSSGQHEAWQRLEREKDRCARIDLSTFSVSDITAMALQYKITLDQSMGERIQSYVGGNPLYASVLFGGSSPDDWKSTTPPPLPREFRDIVLEVYRGLPPDTRKLVAAVAILGGSCTIAAAGSVSATENPTEHLDSAIDSNILDWRRGRVYVAHPLVSDAIVDSLAPSMRRSLHLNAASFTEGRVSIKHRVDATEFFDDALCVELQRSAQEAHERGDNTTAAQYLQWAADVTSDPHLRNHLYLSSSYQQLLVPNPKVVEAERASLIELPTSPMRNLVLGALESEMGRAEDAVRILEEGLDAQPAPDDALVADLTTELAWATGYSGRPASDMLRVLRRLENLHISDPVTDTRAAVIRVFGHAASFGCRSALGDPLIAALPTEAKRAPVAMTDVLVLRGTMRILSGDLAAAVDDLKVAVERYRGGLRTKMLGVAHINLALSKWWAGQWDEADGIAGLAIDLCQESDLAAAYALASYTPAVRGEWVQARKYLDEGMRRAQDIPKLEWVAHLMTGQVLLAHASQNNEMLLDFLRNMDAGVLGRMQERMLGWGAYHISAIHAYGLLLAGRHEDALILSQKVPMVSSQPTWMRQLVHWVAGGIQAANGNQEDAADQYELALESFPAGSKFFEANALHDLSKLVARAGRHRQSGKLSREAYEHYQALRADPFMRMASENLSRLGLPSGDAASNGHLALTSREQQIAQLVRRGLTNKEIATELYVSTKTVEYHLGHTFMKLGVSKRQELRYHPALTQP